MDYLVADDAWDDVEAPEPSVQTDEKMATGLRIRYMNLDSYPEHCCMTIHDCSSIFETEHCRISDLRN